jgi:hypothetical protein
MSPFRWDVLLTGFLFALPVIALGLRGDLSAEETMNRVLWCLGAGWAAVAVLRLAVAPREPAAPPQRPGPAPAAEPLDPSADPQHSPA